jgi:hypothetical protein
MSIVENHKELILGQEQNILENRNRNNSKIRV